MIRRLRRLGVAVLRRAAPKTLARLKYRRAHPLRGKIDRLLKDSLPPQPFDTIDAFQDLQSRYQPFPVYGYDDESLLRRAAERADLLTQLVPSLKTPGQKIVEAGSGDSMVAVALHQRGHQPTVMDLEDWRDERAKHLPFIQGDLSQPCAIDADSLDFCYSFNAFEHVGDPRAMFVEMLRVLRPGGYLYLDFNPLYASPWGLHLYRTFRMPYCQFLFSHDYLLALKAGLGPNDLGQVDEPLTPLNKWKPAEFVSIWNRNRACDVTLFETATNTEHLKIVREFAPAFRGRGLNYDDVTTSGMKVLVRKN